MHIAKLKKKTRNIVRFNAYFDAWNCIDSRVWRSDRCAFSV